VFKVMPSSFSSFLSSIQVVFVSIFVLCQEWHQNIGSYLHSLPAGIRQPDNDNGEFRRQLKAFLFK